MQRTDATSWANALKGVVITEVQISCKQSQDEWTEQTHNLLIAQNNVVLHCLNIFEMKRHIYSTHPDLLGVNTCDQKRHTRYPVKLNYLIGATDSKELLQDWELVLCDVSSNTSQRTSSQSSHNWNEPMKLKFPILGMTLAALSMWMLQVGQMSQGRGYQGYWFHASRVRMREPNKHTIY